jgi:hypothetical protein
MRLHEITNIPEQYSPEYLLTEASIKQAIAAGTLAISLALSAHGANADPASDLAAAVYAGRHSEEWMVKDAQGNLDLSICKTPRINVNVAMKDLAAHGLDSMYALSLSNQWNVVAHQECEIEKAQLDLNMAKFKEWAREQQAQQAANKNQHRGQPITR